MMTRPFGRTGRTVSAIGFGAWAIGGSWGDVDEGQARDALHAALDAGVTFIDTADVYGDGRSERIIQAVLTERSGAPAPYVATKTGRRISPHVAEGYTGATLREHVLRSVGNLGMRPLDLVQLHCPPGEVYLDDRVFDAMEAIRAEGLMRDWGVSVERVEEGLAAIRHPGCASVQIIWNMFRLKPAEAFLPAARAANVAVIARVPLASGLLTGKMRADTTFAADDHRAFNRHGEAFDRGETFSGVPYDVALAAVEELRAALPAGWPMAEAALRWCLMDDAVTVAIPGAKSPAQARANAAAGSREALPAPVMAEVRRIYDARIRPHVHASW